MADVETGPRFIDPDVRLWDDQLRRDASLVVLGIAGVLLVGALLYFGLDATGSGWYLWVAIVLLVVLLIVEAAIVATGIAREEGGPEWLAGPGAAQAATAGTSTGASAQTGAQAGAGGQAAAGGQAEHVHIDLKCPECAELFSVHDTGERPLHTQCPHCGAEGHVDLETPPPTSVHDRETEPAYATESEAAPEQATPEPEPDLGTGPAGGAAAEPGAEAAPEAEAEIEEISLKCPACDTEFTVEDDGTRPLEAVCPGCGRGGKLK